MAEATLGIEDGIDDQQRHVVLKKKISPRLVRKHNLLYEIAGRIFPQVPAFEPGLKEAPQDEDLAPANAQDQGHDAAEEHPGHKPTDAPRFDWEGQIVSFGERATSLVKVRRDLYFGQLSTLPPSASALRVWNEQVKERLWNDLKLVRSKVSRAGKSSKLEIELYMSGKRRNSADGVELFPTIWVLCGSKTCKDAVSKAISKLTWLQTFRFKVEIHKGVNVVRQTDSVPMDDLELRSPIHLPNGSALHLHVETTKLSDPAGGKLCCVTLVHGSGRVEQKFSRLGGVIFIRKGAELEISLESKAEAVDATLCYELTAAHTFWDLLSSIHAEGEPDDASSDSDDNSTSDESEDDDPLLQRSRSESESNSTRLGYRNPRDVQSWTCVPFPDSFGFSCDDGVINRFLDLGDTLKLTGGGADLSVINSMSGRSQDNRYSHGGVETGLTPITSFGNTLPSNEIVTGLRVIVDSESPIPAILLPHETMFGFGDVTFRTRKLELSGPLGKRFRSFI
ncbi:hypothetical protein OQA88_5328 [Cercophora sp. LCS_1]